MFDSIKKGFGYVFGGLIGRTVFIAVGSVLTKYMKQQFPDLVKEQDEKQEDLDA